MRGKTICIPCQKDPPACAEIPRSTERCTAEPCLGTAPYEKVAWKTHRLDLCTIRELVFAILTAEIVILSQLKRYEPASRGELSAW